jgi:hypothetical protein
VEEVADAEGKWGKVSMDDSSASGKIKNVFRKLKNNRRQNENKS